jgi:hypothetical protein
MPVTPIRRRVVLLIYAPTIPEREGRRLHEVMGWQDPDVLTARFIDDVRQASHGIVQCEVVERIERDAWPRKMDGFRYDAATYLRCMRERAGFHQPDAVDYAAMLADADFLRKVRDDEADELWIFGFPYAGFYESCMGGAGAIWCNGPVLPNTSHVARRFCVMGFSYERGVGEMLENLGHRAESIMEHVFAGVPVDVPSPAQRESWFARLLRRLGLSEEPERHAAAVDLRSNLWKRFIRYDKTHPGAAQCGNVHFAPSSMRDYDWGNPREVMSGADDWLHYPNLTGAMRPMRTSDWGGGDIRAHHLWWMQRFPHVAGATPDGRSNNWWRAVAGLEF